MKEIELLKIIFKDSIDILEPLNKIDQEIERLNNIINELSKENQELKEKTKLFHKNRVFSLEYDKETLRDMVLEYQEKIDKAIKYGKELRLFDNESLEFEIGSNFINILKGE